MKHLIDGAPLYGLPIRDARLLLVEAHDFIIDCCAAAIAQAALQKSGPSWGIEMKRLPVQMDKPNRPGIVCKPSERFSEIVNMVATLERMIGALNWFEQQEFPDLFIQECHPTTSSYKGGNDLVLVDCDGHILVRCEVCDIASASAGQNGKERKDIASLGCMNGIPPGPPSTRYFLCTSSEFAGAIQGKNRKVANRPYSYMTHEVGDQGRTVLVELVGL